ALGIIEARFYPLLVVIGMVSFLAASSRTPIAALVFAVEALCGLSNILPVGIGVTIAFLVIETAGVECFNDTVIETKVDKQNAGKTAQIFDMRLTVSADTFVVGKEIRDILWPSTCVVLSVDKNQDAPSQSGIGAGDVLHVHYRSYYPDHTYGELEALVGAQDGKITANVHMAGENHQVPEL
ncbi:MAG: chloride channel protein, partial [Clostridia bacterium]|nr:chloride channel protein [Clostridia bacterium]